MNWRSKALSSADFTGQVLLPASHSTNFAKIIINTLIYRTVEGGWVSFLTREHMAFGYVWEYGPPSSGFNKMNTCTWHHWFIVVVEQIYNCNYSPPGWCSSAPCLMQDIPPLYFYYLSNVLLNSPGDGASITSITSLSILNCSVCDDSLLPCSEWLGLKDRHFWGCIL